MLLKIGVLDLIKTTRKCLPAWINAIADKIRSEIATEVSRMKTSIGKVPGLAVILASQRRECQTYVRNKVIACEEAGIRSEVTELQDCCSEDEILRAITNFNENPDIHGILVQLPLPQDVKSAATRKGC